MEDFNLTNVLLGALVVSVVGGMVGAYIGVFARLRKVETENAEAAAHKDALEKRMESVEGELKALRECMVPMKTDIAAIKTMMETAFNGRKD